MNTAQPAAERTTARAPRVDAEEPDAEESLQHHAKRLVSSRVHALERAVLDPIIALLQRLRQSSGAAEGTEEDDDGEEPRPRKAGKEGGRGADADEGEDKTEAPEPKRRLFVFLIYFSVFLAGGMGGGVLAYELLSNLLDRQATESRRLEAAMAIQTKSIASNQKNFEEAQAKSAEAEKKIAEANKKQIEAEKKLDAALSDAKPGAEKQKKLDEAVKLLEQIRGADRSARPPKSGNCNLAPGNIGALKDCVEDFNR